MVESSAARTGSDVAVAVIRARQAERWRAGEPILVEQLIESAETGGLSEEALLELILGEYALRQERGEKPRNEDFLQRFPTLAPRLERLLVLVPADAELVFRGRGKRDLEGGFDVLGSRGRIGRLLRPADRGSGEYADRKNDDQ